MSSKASATTDKVRSPSMSILIRPRSSTSSLLNWTTRRPSMVAGSTRAMSASGSAVRREPHQRLACHQHAAVVDGEMARKVLHLAAQLEELLPALRPHVRGRHGAGHRVLAVLCEPTVHHIGQSTDELGRKPQSLADLPDRHARLERDDFANHPGSLPPV